MTVGIQCLFKRQVLVLGLISLASCSTWKSAVPNESKKTLSDQNYEVLNGVYRPVDTSGRSLAEELLNIIHELDSNAVTSLQCIDKNRIKVTLREGDEILTEKIIKGKIKDNHFITRQSCKVTFWFILNGLSFSKARIGLLNNNMLTVDTKTSGIGFLIVIPGFSSGGEVYDLEYERSK